MSDRSYFSRQVVLSPDSGLGQIPSRVVVNPNNASLSTVRQTLSDFDADIVHLYTRFRSETVRSGLGYVKRYYRHPLFEMIYRYNNGQERIDLNLVPIGGELPRERLPDLNPDGYLSAALTWGGGDGRRETVYLRQGPLNYDNSESQILLHNTWWIYNTQNTIVPYVFYGTEAEADAEAQSYDPIRLTTPAYRLQQFIRWKNCARVNMSLAEEAQVWGWPTSDYTPAPSLFTIYVYAGSLFQRTEFQLAPTLGGTIPNLIPPAGFIYDDGTIFEYSRVTPQGPSTVNVKVRDGNDKRNMAEFDLTVSQGMTPATSLLKIGPTALRAKNEYTDPETSTGAEVEIAPPPPKPFSDLPSYYSFEHSDDPGTYTLIPGINLVGELPRDQIPVGGFYEIVISATPPDVGYVTLGMSGEFFALNIIREVTSSWTRVADPGETIETNDFPVEPILPQAIFIGTSYGWGISDFELRPGQDEQYPSEYIVSFRLDEVVLPPLDDPNFTIWGYVDLFMTVTPQ